MTWTPYTQPIVSPLDYVDECMKYLGSSLNLTDPFGSLSPQKEVDELTTKGWKAIRDDYRNLSDALQELRKQLAKE